MLKKISLTLIISFISLTFFAQQKDFDKLNDLYQKADYEKCIEKAKKTKEKYPMESTPYYYMATSNFQIYKKASKLSKKMYLTATINNINFALIKDKDRTTYDQFGEIMQEIHDTVLNYANYLWIDDKSQSEFFYKNLAKIYNDTTEQYIELFVPKVIDFEQNLAFRAHTGPINEKDIAGNKQGLWINKYDNGVVSSEVFYKDNHFAGVYRKYYENGHIMANMFFNQTGTYAAAILHNDDGSRKAMGFYNNQKKDSLWQYFIRDSIVIAEENYVDGVKNGYERIYNPYMYPAIMEEKFWKNGKQDSTWSRTYINGKPQFYAEYKDGVRQGKYVAFDESGQTIVEGQYIDNQMHGIWKMWDADEQKIIEIKYDMGTPVNKDELDEAERKIHEEMMEMKGKFEEPSGNFYEDYDNDY